MRQDPWTYVALVAVGLALLAAVACLACLVLAPPNAFFARSVAPRPLVTEFAPPVVATLEPPDQTPAAAAPVPTPLLSAYFEHEGQAGAGG